MTTLGRRQLESNPPPVDLSGVLPIASSMAELSDDYPAE
jgi:hypothetical protein